uniref:Uncharacterized protein n=1 Tax=Clytia hemisphaerica TaxID=252671 RepID=A0A7M6DMW8_9CNID|eukprot:TCONS_00046937-protein
MKFNISIIWFWYSITLMSKYGHSSTYEGYHCYQCKAEDEQQCEKSFKTKSCKLGCAITSYRFRSVFSENRVIEETRFEKKCWKANDKDFCDHLKIVNKGVTSCFARGCKLNQCNWNIKSLTDIADYGRYRMNSSSRINNHHHLICLIIMTFLFVSLYILVFSIK